MRTTWGDALTADNAWQLYPRPQFVRKAWHNLNGLWQYAITPKSADLPTRWDGNIVVPFAVESHLSGVCKTVSPDQRLWYRRTFAHDPAPDTPHLRLHFGAVDAHAAIWLNGAFVGAHSGGFAAFWFDVTDVVVNGENTLVVMVDDPTSAADQPRGKQHLKPNGIWYTPVTGIWQTVWLEPLPAIAIADINLVADIRLPSEDQAEPAADLRVSVLLERPTRDPQIAARITVSHTDANAGTDRDRTNRDRADGDRTVAVATLRTDREITITIPNPRLWHPDAPHLYDVSVDLIRLNTPLLADNDQGITRRVPLRGEQERALYHNAYLREAQAGTDQHEVLDRVVTYVGLRRTEVGPHPATGSPTLLLNGEPLFQLGTLDQGWWPDGLHTPPSDEAMVFEIRYLKSAGFNMVRKHIKVEPQRYYYHCDRMGILVWQDMPSGFLPAQFVAANDEHEGMRTPVSREQYELALHRMINQLCDHPSVVVWVLHNEGWGQYDTQRLTRYLRLLDPSRPINSASGWLDAGHGDLIDRHDYEAVPTAPAPDGVRAPVLGEYGGIGWPITDHLWNVDMRNWGYQTLHNQKAARQAFADMADTIAQLKRSGELCAAVYTQTSDVEGEVNGLLTYDRKVDKLGKDWLRAAQADITDNHD